MAAIWSVSRESNTARAEAEVLQTPSVTRLGDTGIWLRRADLNGRLKGMNLARDRAPPPRNLGGRLTRRAPSLSGHIRFERSPGTAPVSLPNLAESWRHDRHGRSHEPVSGRPPRPGGLTLQIDQRHTIRVSCSYLSAVPVGTHLILAGSRGHDPQTCRSHSASNGRRPWPVDCPIGLRGATRPPPKASRTARLPWSRQGAFFACFRANWRARRASIPRPLGSEPSALSR